MKRTLFSLTVVSSLTLLTAVPFGNAALTQTPKGPDFAVKGSVLISTPTDAVRRIKTAAGYRYVGTQRLKPRLDRLEFDGTLRGQRLDPNSPNIRKAIEQAIQSENWTVEDDSRRVEASLRRKGARSDDQTPEVKAISNSRVRQPAISFDFSGKGEMPFKPGKENTRLNLASGDNGKGQGVITNFRTTVPELRALNGSRIRVNAGFHIDQVDASGVARGRVDFELRSER